MSEVIAAVEAFDRLAMTTGAVTEIDPLAHLGPAPGNMTRRFPDTSNSDLRAGIDVAEIDLGEMRRAGAFIQSGQIRSRENWRLNLALPLAAAAVQDPGKADQLCELLHEISRKPGAFLGGYPKAANDIEWNEAVRRTQRLRDRGDPIRGVGSYFHAAAQNGFITPSPAVDQVGLPIAPPVAVPALPAIGRQRHSRTNGTGVWRRFQRGEGSHRWTI